MGLAVPTGGESPLVINPWWHTTKKFAAYCGVVPKNRDSGGKVAEHGKVRHGNLCAKWTLEIAVQAHVLRIRQGRRFRIYTSLKARVRVPKAMRAVAHRLAFVVYAVWKSRKPYEEGNPGSFEKKRDRLTERAKAKVSFPSVAELLERMLSPSLPRG